VCIDDPRGLFVKAVNKFGGAGMDPEPESTVELREDSKEGEKKAQQKNSCYLPFNLSYHLRGIILRLVHYWRDTKELHLIGRIGRE
jgi:hypothetical protein